ncbi:MAG: TetR/AcrR family transcriptional regulator [Actinobacteria bacterium]|nr:TetR/AcrR family transcriptional regulator [Actinomycetota bacterium]
MSATTGGRGARARIERTADALFYRHGIHITGVELLTHQANVSKRTFYQHFTSKTELVEDYLRRIDAAGGSILERRLDLEGLTPRERLLAIFDIPAIDVFRGCPFHNAAVESAGTLPGVDGIVREHKLRFADRLTAVAGAAGARDPQLLGRQLAVLFEGATALATSVGDTAPLVSARSAAAVLIDAATL